MKKIRIIIVLSFSSILALVGLIALYEDDFEIKIFAIIVAVAIALIGIMLHEAAIYIRDRF